MSQDIVREVSFFLHSVCMGLLITFVYDWILIARKLIKHWTFLISMEDLVFWAACGIGVFYMLYKENNGVLRWFAVAGAAIGMFIYKIIMKKHFVNIMSTCIYKIVWFLYRVAQIILKPIKFLFSAICRCVRFIVKKIKKCKHFVKKKLTVCIKFFKMVLCKH